MACVYYGVIILTRAGTVHTTGYAAGTVKLPYTHKGQVYHQVEAIGANSSKFFLSLINPSCERLLLRVNPREQILTSEHLSTLPPMHLQKNQKLMISGAEKSQLEVLFYVKTCHDGSSIIQKRLLSQLNDIYSSSLFDLDVHISWKEH